MPQRLAMPSAPLLRLATVLVAALLLLLALSTPSSVTGAAYTTLDTVIADMNPSLASEAMVIAPVYDFQSHSVITQPRPSGLDLPSWWTGTRPQWCYSMLTWFTLWEAQGNRANNTRVHIKNLRAYILSNRTRTWTLADFTVSPYTDLWKYPFVAAGNMFKTGFRAEPGGGYSFRPVYPTFFHGYGGVTYHIAEPWDVRAVFTAMDFRLIVDNTTLADDREYARYVFNDGADYYPGNGQPDWGVGYAPGIGGSRFLRATNQWRTSAMLVPNTFQQATWAEMRANPPPLDNGEPTLAASSSSSTAGRKSASMASSSTAAAGTAPGSADASASVSSSSAFAAAEGEPTDGGHAGAVSAAPQDDVSSIALGQLLLIASFLPLLSAFAA